jgi:uncharacterized protein (UPF0332 family)
MKINYKRIISDKSYCEKAFKGFVSKKIIREDKYRLFQKHIQKAVNNMDFANFILTEHDGAIKKKLAGREYYDWCIIIYYYAAYHAALALLSKAGYESKSHAATITAVTLFFYHKDNILEKKDIDFLINNFSLERKEIEFVLDSKEMRERACYGADETFNQTQANLIREGAAELITKIRTKLSLQ